VLVSSLQTLYAPLAKMAAPAAILKEFTSQMTRDRRIIALKSLYPLIKK
jgi:hypothetical protein